MEAGRSRCEKEESEMFEKMDAVLLHYEEIARELSSPEVVQDMDRYRQLMREQTDLTPVVETYRDYQKANQDVSDALEIIDSESDPEMKEMAREELSEAKERVEKLTEEMKVLLLPKDPNDDKNVICEIRAGAGGDEAALFAAEIYRMYVHYAERRGWKTELLDFEESGIGGMKFVNFMIIGQGAYSRMKYESGVHRVQRVPATEAQGRIHTSTITVAGMPEVTDDIKIDIPMEDVRIDITRASGNGGQGVNTTDSAVRLTHLPTGIVIYSQTERSQLQNKNKAWALLRSKLYDMEVQNRHDKEADLRRSQIGTGDRSEKIRTYNFPQSRVTDHRIKLTVYNLGEVMNGALDEILDALIAADQAAKLVKLNTLEAG